MPKDKVKFRVLFMVFLFGVTILGIIEYSGLGKVEYLGYTVDHHISSFFLVLVLFIILKEVGKRIL